MSKESPTEELAKLYEKYYLTVTEALPFYDVYAHHIINICFQQLIKRMAELAGAKNIPLLHNKDNGKEITSCAELRELWGKLGIWPTLPVTTWNAQWVEEFALKTQGELKAYFANEHQKNLEDIKYLIVLEKESYSAKEIAGLYKLPIPTFHKYSNKIKGFPKPVDPNARTNRMWSSEAVRQMGVLIEKHKVEMRDRRVVPIKAKKKRKKARKKRKKVKKK